MILQIDKISLREAMNNDNGRTSSKKLIGFLASIVCLVLLIALIIFYFFHTGDATVILLFVDKLIVIFGIAAGLLGVKSIANAISNRYIQTPTYVQLVALKVVTTNIDDDSDDSEEETSTTTVSSETEA